MPVIAIFFVAVAVLSHEPANASIFGEETAVLLKMLSGQALELERLSESVGIAKEHRELLLQLNEGIDTSVRQIESVSAIIERAQGVDPHAISKISDLTRQIEDIKDIQYRTEEILALKLSLTDQAVAQGAVQSQTAYTMGQEMIAAGSTLAIESKTASPGRAAQITAASSSAQMLSQGVALQTLSQIAQLQAMQLELQKTQIEKEQYALNTRRDYFEKELSRSRKRTRP